MKLRECGWWPKKWTTKNDQDIPSAQVTKDGITADLRYIDCFDV
jgi:hypothetical protein